MLTSLLKLFRKLPKHHFQAGIDANQGRPRTDRVRLILDVCRYEEGGSEFPTCFVRHK